MVQTTDLNELEETEAEEMTKAEALSAIGKVVGFRGHSRTQLRKEDLNSIFWYLTGETVTHWRQFQTEKSPSYLLLRRAVADASGIEYIKKWTESRVFRQDELQGILRALRETDDKRDHASADE
jgi:hypothetical protein